MKLPEELGEMQDADDPEEGGATDEVHATHPPPSASGVPHSLLPPSSQVAGALAVRGLSHRYSGGAQLGLEHIDLDVRAGQFMAIVGPNGCGKTTLLQMMAGLLQPSMGEIVCSGRPVMGPDPDRVGIVFQEPSLFPWLTVQKNIEFPLSLRKMPMPERTQRAAEMTHLMGLTGHEQRYPGELTDDMKQRVSIARALVQDPPVLLLDEPFATLDEQARMYMGDELLRIWQKTRKTVVFVTNHLNEAVYLADQIAVISAQPGRIIDLVDVNLPRPRNPTQLSTSRFAQLRDRIWATIRDQVHYQQYGA